MALSPLYYSKKYVYTKFIDRFLPKIAYKFFCLGSRYYMPQSVFRLFFRFFSPNLDFEKVAFIGVYAPKCLCGIYLSAEWYQALQTR